jgi:hypothetical protein
MPLEFDLELVSAIGAGFTDPKLKFFDDLVNQFKSLVLQSSARTLREVQETRANPTGPIF